LEPLEDELEEEGTQAGDLRIQDPKPIGGQQIAFPELH